MMLLSNGTSNGHLDSVAIFEEMHLLVSDVGDYVYFDRSFGSALSS